MAVEEKKENILELSLRRGGGKKKRKGRNQFISSRSNPFPLSNPLSFKTRKERRKLGGKNRTDQK